MTSNASSAASDEGVLLARIVGAPRDGDETSRPLYRDGDQSFAAYYSAFPASYWSRWTVLESVRLRVRSAGTGSVRVWRSDAQGRAYPVASEPVAADAESVFDLPLDQFGDGGWYWFDLDGAAFVDGGWWSTTPARRRCRASVSITTLNREAFLLPLLASIAADADVVNLLDRVFVVDQGSRSVVDADGFDRISQALGDKLSVVEQPNLGGSGGFSRGMLEALDAGSDAVIILDDDVAIDPESLRRVIRFEEFATEPIVVGGHMLDMYNPTRLHALSEGFRMDRFLWGAKGPSKHDFAKVGLREAARFHRRGDADYTGWWMCLIPSEVLRAAGLSFPFFIKWDDAEYGLRAAEAGYSTVSLPGAAVWHVSWDDKDDSIDWQAYFHARNRIMAALMHSPHPRGDHAMRDEFAVSVKNLLALEYGAQVLRSAAYRDVLAGPGSLHRVLGTRLPELRATLQEQSSGRSMPADEAPEPQGPVPRGVESASTEPPRGLRTALGALPLALRNLRSSRGVDERPPQAALPFRRTRWWITGRFDSVLVTTSDQRTVRWLKRDRDTFFGLLLDAWRSTRRIKREWPRLAAEYRAALPELVSVETWRETTGAARVR